MNGAGDMVRPSHAVAAAVPAREEPDEGSQRRDWPLAVVGFRGEGHDDVLHGLRQQAEAQVATRNNTRA
eukprot:10609657-Lingulodinium_polyedra.AAC.1